MANFYPFSQFTIKNHETGSDRHKKALIFQKAFFD